MKSSAIRNLVLVLLVICIVFLGIRTVWVQVGTFGGGSHSNSPDGLLRASAMSLSAPKFWNFQFWNDERRHWIEYRLENIRTGELLYEAVFHGRPGDCRGGDVKWSVTPKPETLEQLERRKRNAKMLPNLDLTRPQPVHTLTFDCGIKISIEALNSLNLKVCDGCMPESVYRSTPSGFDEPKKLEPKGLQK